MRCSDPLLVCSPEGRSVTMCAHVWLTTADCWLGMRTTALRSFFKNVLKTNTENVVEQTEPASVSSGFWTQK